MEELRFDGRVAVVTGAGRGVGSHYARLLAERGAAVVVNDLGVAPDGSGPSAGPAEQLAAEIRAAGGAALADTHSVADNDGAEAVIQRTLDEFGRIDVLIHNAGIVNGSFEQLRAVNLDAAFWLTEAAWEPMRAQQLRPHPADHVERRGCSVHRTGRATGQSSLTARPRWALSGWDAVWRFVGDHATFE